MPTLISMNYNIYGFDGTNVTPYVHIYECVLSNFCRFGTTFFISRMKEKYQK